MSNPLISVIIPVYNTEKYIEKCILSVLNQTMKNIEIIVVDDCAEDKAINLAEKLAFNNHNIDIFYHNKNKGLAEARNSGITYSRGKYLFFLDSDDYLPKNSLELLYNNAKNNGADMILGNMAVAQNQKLVGVEYINNYINNFINENGHYKNMKTNNTKQFYSGSACNRLYKKSFFIDNKIRFISGIYWEDMPFSLDTWYYAKRISAISNIIYFRTIRDDVINLSITQRVEIKSFLDRDYILNYLFSSIKKKREDIYYLELVNELIKRMLYTTNQMKENTPIYRNDFNSDEWFEGHELRASKYISKIKEMANSLSS